MYPFYHLPKEARQLLPKRLLEVFAVDENGKKYTGTVELVRLPVPVPPYPLLEAAIGYEYPAGEVASERPQPNWIAFSYQAAKPYYEDGLVGASGHWGGYAAYLHHGRMMPFLDGFELFNFGSDDSFPTHKMLLEVKTRKLYAASVREAELVLTTQWGMLGYRLPILTEEEAEKALEAFHLAQAAHEAALRDPAEFERRLKAFQLKRLIAMDQFRAWLAEQPTTFDLKKILEEAQP